MAKEPITPMGGSPHDPTKGLQERNIDNLLKIFGKKEATEALKEIGKMDASTWTQVGDTVKDLKDVVAMGGVGTIIQNIKDTIELQFDQALAPITNQLNSIVTETLGPIYADLQALATDLADFVSDGPTGAFWGSLVGSIWGELGQLIGGVVGAAIEQGWIAFYNWWALEFPKLITEIVTKIVNFIKDLLFPSGDDGSGVASKEEMQNAILMGLGGLGGYPGYRGGGSGVYDPGEGLSIEDRIARLEEEAF